MAATTLERKLDNFSNEIIQKIWPLSENLYLLFTSRKLYTSLNDAYVLRNFHCKLVLEYLRELISNRFEEPPTSSTKCRVYDVQEEVITAKLLTHVLKRSKITNAEIRGLFQDMPGAIKESWPPYRYVYLKAPLGTRVSRRLLYGENWLELSRYLDQVVEYWIRLPI